MIPVLSVASEIFPLVKTGGLADVTGALPGALAAYGLEMHSLVPGYPVVLDKLQAATQVWAAAEFFGGPARILAGEAAGLKIFALDAPRLYARGGNPYIGPDGVDWPDNAERFAALGYAAFLIGKGAVPGFMPEIVHAHDWQAALAPAYLEYAGGARPATVITVHNLAFQGHAPAALLPQLRLPQSSFTPEGFEFYGLISTLKAGLVTADRITTVSPTYAAEICTPEDGHGLDGVLRARAEKLIGIVNGIDTQIWDPSNDPVLPVPFSATALRGRAAAKAALQARLGLAPDPAALLLGVVSRLSHQKGLDVLLEALGALLEAGAQLAVVGSGDAALQEGFLQTAASYPGRVGVFLGYNEDLAHLVQAGSDAISVPSRFEPCGLTQLCALRYGAIPVVSRVGGLADTVIDANGAARAAGVATGVQFSPVNANALRGAIARLVALWKRPEEWRTMQGNAMRSDVGWGEPAKEYAALYRGLLNGGGGKEGLLF